MIAYRVAFVVFLATLFFLIGLNLFGVFEVGESLTAAGGLVAPHRGLASSFWSGALKDVIVFSLLIPVLLLRSFFSAHAEEEEEEIDE